MIISQILETRTAVAFNCHNPGSILIKQYELMQFIVVFSNFQVLMNNLKSVVKMVFHKVSITIKAKQEPFSFLCIDKPRKSFDETIV